MPARRDGGEAYENSFDVSRIAHEHQPADDAEPDRVIHESVEEFLVRNALETKSDASPTSRGFDPPARRQHERSSDDVGRALNAQHELGVRLRVRDNSRD